MGYSALILATILVAGFIFVLHYPPARYSHKRSEGWHTYLHSGAWGIPFAFASFLICLLTQWLCSEPNAITAQVAEAATMAAEPSTNENIIIGFAFLTPMLAGLAGKLAHCCYYGLPSFTHKLLSTLKRGAAWHKWVAEFNQKATRRQLLTITNTVRHDPFENLIVQATNNVCSVMVTLKSHKVYIGMVTNSGVEHGKLEYISIIPLISGYRTKDDFKLELTVHYSEMYKKVGLGRLDDFKTVLPVSEIESVRLFDYDIYYGFQDIDHSTTTDSYGFNI